MPRKVVIPEHWKEDAEQPEWMPEEAEPEDYTQYVAEEEPDYDFIQEQEETPDDDFILGEEKTPDQYIQTGPDLNKTEKLEQEYQDLLRKKVEKKKISEQKRAIRRLKYSPVYDIGGGMREGFDRLAGSVTNIRGTPEQRAIRKQRFKKAMRGMSQKSGDMMTKLGGFGGSGLGMNQINLGTQGSSGAFNMGSGSMDLLGSGNKKHIPNLLKSGKPGSGMNLLGGNMLSGNLFGSGNNMMSNDIFGMAVGKKTVSKKRKSKKGKKKTKKKKANSGSNIPAIMKGGLF